MLPMSLPNHDCLEPGQGSMDFLCEHVAGKRCARHHARQTGRQQARRQRMKPVDVLGRSDGLDHFARVDLRFSKSPGHRSLWPTSFASLFARRLAGVILYETNSCMPTERRVMAPDRKIT
jgi:hypothetical protein